MNDHDLLIELKTLVTNEFRNIKADIREIKDNTKAQIEDHETRIRSLEGYKWKLIGILSTLQVLLGIALKYFIK